MNYSTIDRTIDVGKLIEMYRNSVEDAHKVSNQLQSLGIERPWITVKCKREECASTVTIFNNLKEVHEHTHRIRLEIR